LSILRETGFANTLAGQGVLLKRSREWVLAGAGMLLVQDLRTGKRGAGEGVAECLRLRFGGGRCGQGSLCLSGRRGGREQLDLLADSAAQVAKGLLNVGRVVVGFVVVLRCDGEQLLVHLLERIDSLFEVDIVWRELGLQEITLAHIQFLYAWADKPKMMSVPYLQLGRAAPWCTGKFAMRRA
jgi:hypothetical protein